MSDMIRSGQHRLSRICGWQLVNAHKWVIVAVAAGLSPAASLFAQVNVSVNAGNTLAEMPATGIGLHTSVYANIFGAASLPGEIAASGVQLLRYPGGNYASI